MIIAISVNNGIVNSPYTFNMLKAININLQSGVAYKTGRLSSSQWIIYIIS